MAAIANERSKLTADDATWNKETKTKLLEEFDHNLAVIKILLERMDIRGYKIDPITPVYHGRKDENVEKWISIVSNSLKAAGVPEAGLHNSLLEGCSAERFNKISK